MANESLQIGSGSYRDVQNARLLIDPPAVGSWNMAVDQMLLEDSESSKLVTLRIYGWAPATLSLGYFQKAVDREQHPASGTLNMVRRASGGGAIVHDQELTYSLFVGTDHRWSGEHERLYDLVHNAIIDALSQFKVTAELYLSTGAESESQKPFLCFQRRSTGDLVLDGHKVGGSAQRRSRSAVLQHGSLLVASSVYAPELPGIQELTGISLDFEFLAREIVEGVGSGMGVVFQNFELSDSQIELAGQYQSERFGNLSWTLNR